MSARLTRRSFIGTTIGGGAIALASSPALAGAQGAIGLVLVHRDHQAAAHHLSGGRATSFIAMERDVVRQWRNGLGEQVRDAGTAIAYAPWAEALVLAGLVREAGGESLTARSGSVFVVTMQVPVS